MLVKRIFSSLRTDFTALALLVLGVFLISCTRSGSHSARSEAVAESISVVTSLAESRDMSVYLTGVGTVVAFNTVTVRSRVDGQLIRLAFKEGQNVRAGDLLAVIDPKPYEVALQQMQANLLKDRASLSDARAILVRDRALIAENIISKQQLETQASMVDQLQAAVSADEAQVQTAQLNLSYTQIVSPIDGRVGLKVVDGGNVVRASDPTGLVVLTQLRPIALLFILSDEALPIVADRIKQRGTIEVDAYTQDDHVKLATGKILTIDNQIDSATGMAKFKAVFENKDLLLWPNESVNVRVLLEDRKHSIVIPAGAIRSNQDGSFVYTVNPDHGIDLRPVTVASTQGDLAIISKGLRPGDQVITNSIGILRPDAKVEPQLRGTDGRD